MMCTMHSDLTNQDVEVSDVTDFCTKRNLPSLRVSNEENQKMNELFIY